MILDVGQGEERGGWESLWELQLILDVGQGEERGGEEGKPVGVTVDP